MMSEREKGERVRVARFDKLREMSQSKDRRQLWHRNNHSTKSHPKQPTYPCPDTQSQQCHSSAHAQVYFLATSYFVCCALGNITPLRTPHRTVFAIGCFITPTSKMLNDYKTPISVTDIGYRCIWGILPCRHVQELATGPFFLRRGQRKGAKKSCSRKQQCIHT